MEKQKRERKYKKRLYKKNKKFRLEYKYKAFLNRICVARKSNKVIKSKFFDHVGFNFFDFVNKFESMFDEKMNWGNYGEWHVDHIKPKSLFSYSSCKDLEFKSCWGLDNLAPLLKQENLKKYNKVMV